MRPNATRSAILQSASSFVSSPVSLPRLLPFASPSSTIFQPPRCVLLVPAVPVVPESPPPPLAHRLQTFGNRPSTATSTILQPPSNHHPHAHRPSLLPSVATRQDILIPPTPPPSPMPRPCNRNYPTLLAPLSLTNSFRCERRGIAMAQSTDATIAIAHVTNKV